MHPIRHRWYTRRRNHQTRPAPAPTRHREPSDPRDVAIAQLAGWSSQLAELVADLAGDAGRPTDAEHARELADRIQHVATTTLRRTEVACDHDCPPLTPQP